MDVAAKLEREKAGRAFSFACERCQEMSGAGSAQVSHCQGLPALGMEELAEEASAAEEWGPWCLGVPSRVLRPLLKPKGRYCEGPCSLGTVYVAVLFLFGQLVRVLVTDGMSFREAPHACRTLMSSHILGVSFFGGGASLCLSGAKCSHCHREREAPRGFFASKSVEHMVQLSAL